MRKVFGKGLMLFMALVSLVSCSETKRQSETTYLPFKSSEDGKWGMIGTDGTVLFEEEFKDQPTSAMNDRFMVKNGNGFWEIFTAESKPKKIGDEYLEIADFTASVTPAVKKNERICLIDKNGNVKTTLDKVGQKNIVSCSKFRYGYAEIVLEDGSEGIINTKGEVVISPKKWEIWPLADGYFVAQEEKETWSLWSILNTKGEVVSEIKTGEGQRYLYLDDSFTSVEYIPVCSTVDGERQWGIIDYNKNVIVKPSSKYKRIEEIRNKKFIYSNGENYGVMSFDGETIIRAKYDYLRWADDNLLIAYDMDAKYSLINLKDDKLTKDEYMDILPFYDDNHAAVKISDNSWSFINTKGEEIQLKNVPDIFYIGPHSACTSVHSDYLDIDAIVSKLQLSKKGLMGYSLDMTPLQVIKAYNEIENELDKRSDNPDDYDSYGLYSMGNFHTQITKKDITIKSSLTIPNMTEITSNGKVWSKAYPTEMSVELSGYRLRDKISLLYEKVASIVKSYGKVVKENSGAVIVNLNDSQGWVVSVEQGTLYIQLFNSGIYWDLNIDNNCKEGESTKEYIKSPLVICPKCDGQGEITCPTCEGDGRVYSDWSGSFPCTSCGGESYKCGNDGTGKIMCPVCKGVKKIKRQ